jgi:hypothetical protein
MSRNGIGVYSLPTGNPVVPNTTISTTWANSTLSDIASALTQSVAADGQTPLTGDLNLNTNDILNGGAATFSGTVATGDVVTDGNTTITGYEAIDGKLTVGDKLGVGTLTPTSQIEVVGTGRSPTITLADSATIAWDTSLGQVATYTFVSTNRTMGTPTNLANGAFYALAIVQNAGLNTMTWSSAFKWNAGQAPVLSSGAGQVDFFVFRSEGGYLYEQGRSQAVA